MTEATDQAIEQSVEDKIYAKFNDEPEQEPKEAPPEEEGSEAVAEPVDIEIEYEGERFKIPKQLEKAILQERDYTRKSQELAEQRRQVEHDRQVAKAHQLEREFQQSVSAESQQLTAIENYLKQLENVDTRSMSLDEKTDNMIEIQRFSRRRQELQSELTGKRQEFDGKVKETMESIRQSAKDVLSKSIPGFNDAVMDSMRTYGKTQGFSEQDVDGITSHPASSSVLYKAMRYDQLQASKAEAVKTATTANPVIKPGSSNPMPQAVKDKLNYKNALKGAKTRDERNAIVAKRIEGMF